MPNTTVTTGDYGTLITDLGAQKIAAAILSVQKLNITEAAVGDGNGSFCRPSLEQTALLRECWRGQVADCRINDQNPNMLDVKFIVPPEVGGFTIREAGLFDTDGDLIAVCNTPDAQKVAITEGVSFPVTLIMHILVTDVSTVEVKVNPSLNTVSREELQETLQQHSKDAAAHPQLLEAIRQLQQEGLSFVLGGPEPTTGPTLWFDTALPPLLLDLVPAQEDSLVQMLIQQKLYGVNNIGLNITPSEGQYSIQVPNVQ